MALRQYKDGAWREVGGLNHRVDEETKPVSALYQYKAGQMLPVWEAGNLRTADGYILMSKDGYIINVKETITV